MKTLSDIFRELPKNSPHLSAPAQIRKIIDEVEYALSRGVSYKEIVGVLEQGGITISVSGLHPVMYRHRKKQKTSSEETDSAPAPESPVDTGTTMESGLDNPEGIILWERGIQERLDTGKSIISISTTQIITISDFQD